MAHGHPHIYPMFVRTPCLSPRFSHPVCKRLVARCVACALSRLDERLVPVARGTCADNSALYKAVCHTAAVPSERITHDWYLLCQPRLCNSALRAPLCLPTSQNMATILGYIMSILYSLFGISPTEAASPHQPSITTPSCSHASHNLSKKRRHHPPARSIALPET